MIIAIDWTVWESNPSLGEILTDAEAHSGFSTMDTVYFQRLVLNTPSLLDPTLQIFWSYARTLSIWIGMSWGDLYLQTVSEYKAVPFIDTGCYSETIFRVQHSSCKKIILMIVFSELISFSNGANHKQFLNLDLPQAYKKFIATLSYIILKLISIEQWQAGY